MHCSRRTHLPRLLLALCVAALAACDRMPNGPLDGGPLVALAFQASVASAPEVNVIAVEVTGPGIPVPILGNFAVVDGRAEGTLQVPAGNGRVFTARGFDAQGAVTHEGSVTRDVRPNWPPVEIPLTPRGVGVPIVVMLGSYLISIEPLESGLEEPYPLDAGQMRVFRAVVRDASGERIWVDAAELTWASSNPAVARVASNAEGHGEVTGFVRGTTDLGVSFRGVAAQVGIRVEGGDHSGSLLISMTASSDVVTRDQPVTVTATITNRGTEPTEQYWLTWLSTTVNANSRATSFSISPLVCYSFNCLMQGLEIGQSVTVTFSIRQFPSEICAPTTIAAVSVTPYGSSPQVWADAAITLQVTCSEPISLTDRLVFVSDRDGTPDLYSIRPDGNGLARLTDSPAAESSPVWSRDRSRIAFLRDEQLWTINADGTGEARVSNFTRTGHQTLSWSPDGSRIAVGRIDAVQGSQHIILVDVATGSVSEIEAGYGRSMHLDWSPDGTHIAFATAWTPHGQESRISLLRLADESTRDVCFRYAGDCFLMEGQLEHPRWSPDGAKILFGQILFTNPDASYRRGSLMMVDVSDESLTSNWSVIGPGYRPAWSPDGTHIAFQRPKIEWHFTSSSIDDLLDVWVIRLDGTGPHYAISGNPYVQDQMADW
jgi:hypothetical protein